jgi:hypothetical protein
MTAPFVASAATRMAVRSCGSAASLQKIRRHGVRSSSLKWGEVVVFRSGWTAVERPPGNKKGRSLSGAALAEKVDVCCASAQTSPSSTGRIGTVCITVQTGDRGGGGETSGTGEGAEHRRSAEVCATQSNATRLGGCKLGGVGISADHWFHLPELMPLGCGCAGSVGTSVRVTIAARFTECNTNV